MTSTPLILALSDLQLNLSNAGGKALNLGIMCRNNLPVPDGFVVTTAAYTQFVTHNQLEATIQHALQTASSDLEMASATLRQAFEAAEIPEALCQAIASAYTQLQGAVAVRSSATAEDLLEASFAGQQDSYLNIQGETAVLHAIRRCWGSLWTARAMAYRVRQNIVDVALAVVVQKMAPARSAGVLFTAHPLTGRRDRAVINANWGLGESLVSGKVNPDSYVVEKATGRVLRVELGEKALKTVPTEMGTQEMAVPEAERQQRALKDSELAALVRYAGVLEGIFGGPQDIEWAIVDGQPVLLQSRAITTAPPPVPGDDQWPTMVKGEPQSFDFWTQQDMGERWPDPITPLTWSISDPMNQYILDQMLKDLKAPYAGKIRWSCRAFGYVYMNEGALLYAYTQGMGMPLALMKSGLTHPDAAPKDSQNWKIWKALQHFSFFYQAAMVWEKNVKHFEASFPEIDAWVDAFAARDLHSVSDLELLKELKEVWFQRILHYVAFHTNATSLSMSSYDALADFVVKQGGDSDLAQTLVSGLSGVISAEMVPALSAMAQQLREMGLADDLQRCTPLEALQCIQNHPPIQQQLRAFLQRHGHRAAVEAELRYPRWIEAPEQVVEQLQSYLRNPSTVSSEQAALRREAATADYLKKLGMWHQMGFRYLLDRAHRFTRMRDNGQGYVVKLLLPIRMLLAELGRRFVSRGWLKSEDDLFFLVQEELWAIAQAPSPLATGLQGQADARRAAQEHWCRQTPPDALDAEFEPVQSRSLSDDPNSLCGVAASRGLITGIARIVATPQDANRLQPGEILVTRSTDPGWTPVFSRIGGAVIEIGGLLSHGAIVAREYGLPAVVGVPQCTRKIQDGQRITVDGGKGQVLLLVDRD